MSTVYAGNHSSSMIGHGIDTIGYREYSPEDDVRMVDWKIYGRTRKMYVREYEEEKTMTTHILLDSSKSMDYGNEMEHKYSYGAYIATAIAYLATNYNDRFMISTFSDDIKIRKPLRGKSHLYQLVNNLFQQPADNETLIDDCMRKYEHSIKSTSMVVLISDMLSPIEKIESTLRVMSKHDLIIVQLLTPDEFNPNLTGDFKLNDMETGKSVHVHGSKKTVDHYHTLLEQHNNHIRKLCSKYGASYNLISTDSDIFDSIISILHRGM
jgi:uncharacterized protein (DUF58 family)